MREHLPAPDVDSGSGSRAFSAPAGTHAVSPLVSRWLREAGNAATARIARQRMPEPAQPVLARPVTLDFESLRDGETVSDPTGRGHGITLQRSGDELLYTLPRSTPRRVPRPVLESSSVRAAIGRIEWSSAADPQVAFSVSYLSVRGAPVPSLMPEFRVNVFGRAAQEDPRATVAYMTRRPAPPDALEVLPEGLEIERIPGELSDRPRRHGHPVAGTRYHVPGSDNSLYVPRAGAHGHTLRVLDARGRTVWAPPRPIESLDVRPSGEVTVVWRGRHGLVAAHGDLRDPHFLTAPVAPLADSASRGAAIARLHALGVEVAERGSRFTEEELDAAVAILTLAVPSLGSGHRHLRLVRELERTGGQYETDVLEVRIPGYVAASPEEQRNTVFHETTHSLAHLAGLMILAREQVPPDVARQASDLLSHPEGALGPVPRPSGYRTPTAGGLARALSRDTALNLIWHRLHRRFGLSDVEGTGDIRGLDVADESRYLGSRGPRGEAIGHGFENVQEFIASFVASSMQYQSEMARTVREARSPELAALYRDLWDWTVAHLVRLPGPNPYPAR